MFRKFSLQYLSCYFLLILDSYSDYIIIFSLDLQYQITTFSCQEHFWQHFLATWREYQGARLSSIWFWLDKLLLLLRFRSSCSHLSSNTETRKSCCIESYGVVEQIEIWQAFSASWIYGIRIYAAVTLHQINRPCTVFVKLCTARRSIKSNCLPSASTFNEKSESGPDHSAG